MQALHICKLGFASLQKFAGIYMNARACASVLAAVRLRVLPNLFQSFCFLCLHFVVGCFMYCLWTLIQKGRHPMTTLEQKTPEGFTVHPFGYPSAHLAQQALCRWFDNGEITFDQWLDAKTIKHCGKYFAAIQE